MRACPVSEKGVLAWRRQGAAGHVRGSGHDSVSDCIIVRIYGECGGGRRAAGREHARRWGSRGAYARVRHARGGAASVQARRATHDEDTRVTPD